MQVKYIVYQKKDEKNPKVAIWQTDGSITHPIYRQQHNIEPKEMSSVGYLNFNPQKEIWELEHYPLNPAPSSILGVIHQAKINKRDKIFVQKEIYKTDFLKDKKLQMETYKESLALKQEWKLALKAFLLGR